MDNWFTYWNEKKEEKDNLVTKKKQGVSNTTKNDNETLIEEKLPSQSRTKDRFKIGKASQGTVKQVEKAAVKGSKAKRLIPKDNQQEKAIDNGGGVDNSKVEVGKIKTQTAKEQWKTRKFKSKPSKLKSDKIPSKSSEEETETIPDIQRVSESSEQSNMPTEIAKGKKICWKSPYEKKDICFSVKYTAEEEILNSLGQGSKKVESPKPIYEQLICPVCGKLYDHPQILPCKHSFCERCIPKKTSTKPIDKHHIYVKCPVCQDMSYFTSIEKVRFPDNVLLMKVLNRFENERKGIPKGKGSKKEIYCEACDRKLKKVAVKKCISHNLNVCIDCLQKHGDSNKPDKGVIEPSVNYFNSKCFDHPDSNLVVYCQTDKNPICEACIFGQHKDHLIIPLEEAYNKDVFDLHDAIAKYRNVKDQSDNELLSLHIVRSNFQGDKAMFEKEITKEFTLLHGILQKKEKEVKEIMHNEVNIRLKKINEFEQAKKKSMYGLDSLADFAKEVLKETNESVFLQMSGILMEQLTDKINQILFSEKELNQSPFNGFDMNVKKLSAEIEELFVPILTSSTSVKDQSVSTIMEKHESLFESEILHSKISDNPEEEITIDELSKKESHTSDEMEEHSTPSEHSLVAEAPKPPTIYHHQVHGTTAKIFWMVPEADTVDSFSAQFQEISSSRNKMASSLKPSGVFTGIKASSFETSALKPHSEYHFWVRAANIAGESEWSYPYKVVTADSKALGDQTAPY